MQRTIPDISKLPFWDVDFSNIDFEKDSIYVVGKVMNHGLWDDVKAIVKYYGRERLRNDVTAVADLRKDTIAFLCLLLNLTPTDFKCYEQRRSHPAHWNY